MNTKRVLGFPKHRLLAIFSLARQSMNQLTNKWLLRLPIGAGMGPGAQFVECWPSIHELCFHSKHDLKWVGWKMPAIPALRRYKQEDGQLKVIPGSLVRLRSAGLRETLSQKGK